MTKISKLFNKISMMFFIFIVFTLEWALWVEIPLTSTLFSISCIGIFVLSIVQLIIRLPKQFPTKVLPEYFSFLLWAVLMILGYQIAAEHSEITFLYCTMDSYSIFFKRALVSILPCMVFVDLNSVKDTKFFKAIFGIIVFSNAWFTLNAVRINPDAVRARETMEMIGEEELLFGTPAYAMVYGMALLFPVLLQKCKKASSNGESKIFYIVCTTLVALTIFVSQFATALILACVGTVVFMLLNMKLDKRIILVCIVLFLVLSIHLTNLDSIFFNWLSGFVKGTWSGKLQDIAVMLLGGSDTGSIADRTDLYSQSWKAFKESPVLGKLLRDTTVLGGHATAIDILGLVGFVGFIPFVLTVYFNYKRLKTNCDYSSNKPAIIAIMIEFVLLVFLKNIITSLPIFFAFFVLTPFLLKLKDEN